MKVLELFSGTASFTNVAKERGHKVFTIDIEPKFNPDLTMDIIKVTPEIIIEKFGKPEVIWASPPCTTFSVASISRYWDNGKPKNEKTIQGINIVLKTLELINILKPKYWIIENPRGMLRKQTFMDPYRRVTVTYCQYGDKIMKPTDLWTNVIFIPKMCKPGMLCHEKASRGTKKGIQGIYNKSYDKAFGRKAVLRAKVPKQLCEVILNSIEKRELNNG